jgi:dipeptidyl-peptidase-4
MRHAHWLRHAHWQALLALLPLGAAIALPESNPMPAAVYARAEALLGPNLEPKVLNVFVTPHWLNGKDEFWYRRELSDGADFVVVDAASGLKRAAFDHVAVAHGLAAALGTPVDPKQLPFDDLRFSADGKALKVSVAARTFDCDLSVGRCSGGTVPRVHPEWLLAPDGRSGVSTRDGNLWVSNALSGDAKVLTTDGMPDAGYGIWPDGWSANFVSRQPAPKEAAPLEARWAPDSRTVLVPFVDQRRVAIYPFIESAPADRFRPRVFPIRIPLVGEHTAVFEWSLIDVATGATRHVDLPYAILLSLQQDMTAFREISWSADSKHLYLVAHGDNMESAYVFDVEVATGNARTVLEEHLAPRTDLNSTSYNPVNVRVVRDGRELIWFSQRDGWGHLYRYDMRTGKQVNRITGGAWLVRDIIDIDESRGVIYFTGAGREPGNPYFRYLYRVNFDGTNLKLLSPEPADHLLLPHKPFVLSLDGITAYAPVSPSGRYVVYNYSRIEQPTKFVIRRVADAGLVAEVETADATRLYAAGWRPPTSFTVKAADGTDLWGVMYQPSDFDARRRYPIIDAQYASPLTAVVPHNFYQAYRGKQPLAPSSYAELGFIVISVDARGTTYRSEKFLQAGYGALNRIGLDDHIATIRSLAATRPYLDTERVGIVGHSYGGFAALRAMLEFPDFFKVGISSAAMMDTEGMYADYHWSAFQGRAHYSDGSEWRPTPSEVAANWKHLSASAQVHQLKGKLLLQMGELDENVPPGQILQFVDSLIKDNKDFELIYMPSRDHQFIGDGYVMRRDWDFMVRNLQGREPPPGYRIEVNRR